MFFSFDGIDGVGKSTQLALFVDYLRGQGNDVVTCRDPGTTDLGEVVRNILLQDMQTPICAASEMFLYMVARAQLVQEVIAPALEAGKTVVTDRFLLSNVVYQGHAGGLGAAAVWEVGRVATGGVEPDLTFLLDMPVEDAARRLDRELDRMERRGADYRRRLREGFLAEAETRPEKMALIDASGAVGEVQMRVQRAAERLLAGGQ